jgi:hypothetical protein
MKQNIYDLHSTNLNMYIPTRYWGVMQNVMCPGAGFRDFDSALSVLNSKSMLLKTCKQL